MPGHKITHEIAKRTGLRLPDTAIVEEAIERARSYSAPFLFNHVMRSALFAHAFADLRPSAEDREVVAVSAILHDLGLADDSHALAERFEIRSAQAARDFALDHGMADERAWLVWDTIALHPFDFNLYKENEAWPVQMGILADVVGEGLDRLDRAVVEQVVGLYPRLGFKSAFYELLVREAATSPPQPFHPVTMIRHHGQGCIHVPDARALIERAPFED